jgi:divalent metal cation (Fe/Co/Zn/Cd) transporter
VRRIEHAITSTEGVERVIHMKTMHLGPEEVLVAAKIAVGRCETGAAVADIINRAEISIRDAEPVVTELYLEPDIYNPDHVPADRPERPAAPSH